MNPLRSTAMSLVVVAVALVALVGCADPSDVTAAVGGPGGALDAALAEPVGDDPQPEPSESAAAAGLFGAAPRPPILVSSDGVGEGWGLVDGSAAAARTTTMDLVDPDGLIRAVWACGIGTDRAHVVGGAQRVMAVALTGDPCVFRQDDGTVMIDPGTTGTGIVLVDTTDPLRPTPLGTLSTTSAPVSLAADGSGRFLYVAENDPDAGRGVLHVINIADTAQPVRTHSIPLAHGATLKDIEVDATDQRLYLSATTYLHVFDLTDPAAPQVVGRLYDYMVRNYDEVSIDRVSDPQFGYRSFLTVKARLGGGNGCPTGFSYTYDITGDLFERPLMIADSEIPRLRDHGRADPVDPVVGECPEPRLQLNNETFRLEVSWLIEDAAGWTPLRRDLFPYNITAQFREQAEFCLLVPT